MFDNYVRDMSREDKDVFMQAFMAVMSIDGNVVSEERKFLVECAKAYGMSKEEVTKIIKKHSLENFFSNVVRIVDRRLKLQLIREMLVLVVADNDIDDKEMDLVLETAEILEIERKRVYDLFTWVQDQKIWIMKGRYFLETDC